MAVTSVTQQTFAPVSMPKSVKHQYEATACVQLLHCVCTARVHTHVSSMSPTLASATKRLPDFAGDPHWDPEKAFKVLPSLRVPDTPVSQTLPTWREFQEAANQPKKKAMGMDAVPPHTI